MTLIDSVDSIVMLYAYAGFPDRKFALWESIGPTEQSPQATQRLMDDPEVLQSSTGAKTPPVTERVISVAAAHVAMTPSPLASMQALPRSGAVTPSTPADVATLKTIPDDAFEERNEEVMRQLRVKRNAMSGLSIVLTLMSILVAFTFVAYLHLSPLSSLHTDKKMKDFIDRDHGSHR